MVQKRQTKITKIGNLLAQDICEFGRCL